MRVSTRNGSPSTRTSSGPRTRISSGMARNGTTSVLRSRNVPGTAIRIPSSMPCPPGDARTIDSSARPAATVVWLLAVGVPIGMRRAGGRSPLPEQDAWAIPALLAVIVASLGPRRGAPRHPAAGATASAGSMLGRSGWGSGIALLGQLWAYLSLARYGRLAARDRGGSDPRACLFFPAFFLVMLVPLLFPDGRLMSRRWAVVGGAAPALVGWRRSSGSSIRPARSRACRPVDNPLGIAEPWRGLATGADRHRRHRGARSCIPAGIVAAVLRYRRGTLVERKQLKWFGSVLVLALSMFFAATVLPQPYGQGAWIVASASIGARPGRDRRRDPALPPVRDRPDREPHDRLGARDGRARCGVRRDDRRAPGTARAVHGQQHARGGRRPRSLAAALFQPLRRAGPAAVDRRFNRARVDAQRAIEDVRGAPARRAWTSTTLRGRLVRAPMRGGAAERRGAVAAIRRIAGR